MTEVTDEVIIPVRGVVTMMGNLWIVAGESNVPVAFVPKGAWNSNDITSGAAVPLQLMDPAHERTEQYPGGPPLSASQQAGSPHQFAGSFPTKPQPPHREARPVVGQIVHYVSYGTPKGEYTSQCRAAVVTEVGQWVTVETTPADSYSRSEGRPIRTAEQWFYADAVALTVFNPTGVFFNGAGPVACKHDEPFGDHVPAGGTWHYIEDER